MLGAPTLSANAAMRSGAGLCRIAGPKELLPQMLVLCPTATGFALPARDVKPLLEFADLHDALVVGPGLGMGPFARRMVIELLERHPGPMVLDADALNILSSLESSEWPQRRDWSNVVLTPHMVEFMRLMAAVTKRGTSLAADSAGRAPDDAAPTGRSLVDDEPSTADGIPLDDEPAAAAAAPAVAEPADVGSDRSALAELLSRATGCVVVLKGANTVVADGQRFGINRTGNPAMATGGSGDVLSGVIGTFLAQSFKPAQAALLGVHVHGLAGDLAAKAIGGVGVVATDIIAYLPSAIKSQMA